MLRTWLVIGAVAAVGAAAAVHAVLGGDSERGRNSAAEGLATLEGPDVPPQGALAGSLLFTADGCRLHRLELTTAELVRTELGTGCGFWPSPGGQAAVVVRSGGGPAESREIWLVRLGGEVELVRRLGMARGDVTWSAGGDRLAWCAEDGATVVADADGRELARVQGCGPRFTPGGRLLTAMGEPGRILADGEPLLDEGDLRRPLPPAAGPIRVLGYDQRGDGLLAVVVASGALAYGDLLGDQGIRAGPDVAAEDVMAALGTGSNAHSAMAVSAAGSLPRLVIELWRGARLEESVSLRGLAYPFGNLRFGEVVRFSPGGGELAVGSYGLGVPLMLIDARTLTPLLRPTVQDGFAWSPDGAWFALAGGGEIRIAGAVRSEAAYVLPIGAATLAWR